MNSTYEGFKSGFLKAHATLATKQGYMVKAHTTAGEVVICSSIGEPVLGVMLQGAAADEICQIGHYGVFPAVYGDTITPGEALMVNASGALVPHTGTYTKAAVAIEGGSSGETHSVFMLPSHISGYSGLHSIVALYFPLTSIADGDILTNYTPGFAGTIEKFSVRTIVPVTTAAKASTLHLEIGAVALTGGVLSLTSAGLTPLGKVVDATAITDDNAFGATDTISIVAASTTAFIEGTVELLIVLKGN